MTLRSWPRERVVVFTVVCVIAMMFAADVVLLAAVFWLENHLFNGVAKLYWMVACVGAMFGIFGAQLFLAVLFASLGDGSNARRILYSTFGVAIFTNLLVLFSVWVFRGAWSEHVWGFLMPMMLFYLLQIPFWGIRSYFGWMVASPWSELKVPPRFRFTLTHLLGWSVFLAVPLCIIQAVTVGPISRDLWLFLFWAVMLNGLLAWLLYTSLSARMSVRKGMFAAAAGVCFAVAVQAAIMWLWESRTRANAYLALAVTNIVGSVVVVACLVLARSLGYRLLPFAAHPAVDPQHGDAVQSWDREH